MSQKLCDAKKHYMQHRYHLASKMLDLPLLATHLEVNLKTLFADQGCVVVLHYTS